MIKVSQSDDYGEYASISPYFLFLTTKDGKQVRQALDKITYLKQIGHIEHPPTFPSLKAMAQQGLGMVGAMVFLSDDSFKGYLGAAWSAMTGYQLAEQTKQRHQNSIAKITYLVQIGFDDNTTAILEMGETERKKLAKQFERFLLI